MDDARLPLKGMVDIETRVVDTSDDPRDYVIRVTPNVASMEFEVVYDDGAGFLGCLGYDGRVIIDGPLYIDDLTCLDRLRHVIQKLHGLGPTYIEKWSDA